MLIDTTINSCHESESVIDEQNLDHWQLKKRRRLENIRERMRVRRITSYNKFVSELVMSGVRRETAEEYIRDIKSFGDIRIENGEIYWIGSSPEPSL